MAVSKFTLTRTELDWLVSALNHQLANLQEEVDSADSDIIRNLGRLTIDTRTALRTKLNDIQASNVRTIAIH